MEQQNWVNPSTAYSAGGASLFVRGDGFSRIIGGPLSGIVRFAAGVVLAFSLVFLTNLAAHAQNIPLGLRDSFPLGDSRGSLCQVQNRSVDAAKATIFDRSWAIVCRDSALPVGYVFALRRSAGDPEMRLAARRAATVSCDNAQTIPASLIEDSAQRQCAWRDGNLAYTLVRADRGKTSYFAEGFAAYDSALSLALRSIIADELVPGTVEIATTSIGDPAAFARVQALTLAPDEALAEGYRRNNSGDYAQAAEFFETLQQRFTDPEQSNLKPEEFLSNRALQLSNLGKFAEADSLFAQARALGSDDQIQQRLLRNFEAIHLINRRRFGDAIIRLDVPVRAVRTSAEALRSERRITTQISDRINRSDDASGMLAFVDDLQLTDEERAYIIDAQALQLRATALRLQGNNTQARNALVQSLRDIISIREGRVVSIIRLRAQMMAELALVDEALGDYGSARSWLNGALELLQMQYPETSIVNAVRARLASFELRRGNSDEAQRLYRQVVTSSLGQREALTGFGNQLAPYFDLLVSKMAAEPALASDFFDATQILIRPGVAETQAILARELSGGEGEASRLFRQSLNLSRSIERSRIRLSALERAQTPESAAMITSLSAELVELEAAQQGVLVRLAEFPQYRAAAAPAMTLAELQAGLGPDEAFVKLAEVGGREFVFYTDANNAVGYAANLDADEMAARVDKIRDSISLFENGQYITLPFDATTARALYRDLFGPIAPKIETAGHLIFEPDGAMLRLPVNLLVTRDEPVAEFERKLDDPVADVFDMRGMAWLGAQTAISTAVSARAFIDARNAPASQAKRQYLGMGQNESVFMDPSFVATQVKSQSADPACRWPLNQWNDPISAAELRSAQSLIGEGQSTIITGQEFSDDRILARDDLDNYRVLHFATHGLVTPPSSRCPARPALLTSFGGAKSDGLLSFQEIFDLKLDADMVILSACDTASRASVTATREAGLESGGGTALDGLVRSFVGAGGRSVLASHWPAPDDYDATQRLITDLFRAPANSGVADGMMVAQRKLMNDPLTSHPYYWSGFAIIGDGRRPLVRPNVALMANDLQDIRMGGGQ